MSWRRVSRTFFIWNPQAWCRVRRWRPTGADMINRDSRSGSLPLPGSGSAPPLHLRHPHLGRERTPHPSHHRASTGPPRRHGRTQEQVLQGPRARSPHRAHDRDRREPWGAPREHRSRPFPDRSRRPNLAASTSQAWAAQDTRTRSARPHAPAAGAQRPRSRPRSRPRGEHPAPQERGAPAPPLTSPSRDPYRTHAAHESRKEKASTTAQQPRNQQHAIPARPAALTR